MVEWREVQVEEKGIEEVQVAVVELWETKEEEDIMQMQMQMQMQIVEVHEDGDEDEIEFEFEFDFDLNVITYDLLFSLNILNQQWWVYSW